MNDDCEGCSIMDINQAVPLNVAVIIYGYLIPLLICIMACSNTFIILVLSQKHLRTPTNTVLLSMATFDLLTGLTPLPWFIYYYTFQVYKIDEKFGLSHEWLCKVYPYVSYILPTMFHTSVIWLTVFLAIQRYVYVCEPNAIHRFCTPRITKISIILITLCSTFAGLPDFLGKSIEQIQIGERRTCLLRYTTLVLDVFGIENFYTFHYWLRALCIHILPCLLLIVFTYKLSRTIRRTEVRKRSFVQMHDSQCPTTPLRSNDNYSSSGSRRSLFATNRMLMAICILFLLIEVPAALIFITHYVITKHISSQAQGAYQLLNIALIIRNLLIIIASPIQFSIYCSMSEQFRLTARQLFSSKLLFVAQAQATYHGGRRYSLVLVDVDSVRQKRFSFRRQSSKSLAPILALRRKHRYLMFLLKNTT